MCSGLPIVYKINKSQTIGIGIELFYLKSNRYCIEYLKCGITHPYSVRCLLQTVEQVKISTFLF